jgi:hypothetical protein
MDSEKTGCLFFSVFVERKPVVFDNLCNDEDGDAIA